MLARPLHAWLFAAALAGACGPAPAPAAGAGAAKAVDTSRADTSRADTAQAGTPAAAASAADSAAFVPLALRSKGSATAPVTVYEMSDFQCPFCRRHALETFPALEREFVQTGKVRWVFLNFPITEIHPNATPAAEFSLCAAREGRFWPAHDVLFRQQEAWAKAENPVPLLTGYIDSIGASPERMLACLRDPSTRAALRHDAEGAARAGARSTPSFYIEGGLMVGAYPPEVFRQVLDSVHAAKTATPAR
jgi:protein-disulfide isomerase